MAFILLRYFPVILPVSPHSSRMRPRGGSAKRFGIGDALRYRIMV